MFVVGVPAIKARTLTRRGYFPNLGEGPFQYMGVDCLYKKQRRKDSNYRCAPEPTPDDGRWCGRVEMPEPSPEIPLGSVGSDPWFESKHRRFSFMIAEPLAGAALRLRSSLPWYLRLFIYSRVFSLLTCAQGTI